jgi:leucine dehydrogenase
MRVHVIGDFTDQTEYDGHEQVLKVEDVASGLKAFISIHSTKLGSALGGCRMWNYESEDAALRDALRLSRAMTYKNALAGLAHGGGKSVIIGDARKDKTSAVLHSFARALDSLEGSYISAEDVGISMEDIETMRTITPHVRGIAEGGVGDPSPHTAHGVFCGIKATAMAAFGTDDLSDACVIVQGLGNVGMSIARYLYDAGAKLLVSDIKQNALDAAVANFSAEIVTPDKAHAADADIFCPCALGGVLSAHTIPNIRAKAVAGSANNQLNVRQEDGRRLMDRGIIYAPDYVINAGGVIAISHEGPDFDTARLREDLGKIGSTLTKIFERSGLSDMPTYEVAEIMALERLG